MNRRSRWPIMLGACLTTGIAAADDVTGEDAFVCTAWHAITCTTEAVCNQTEAWRLSIPDFVKVDLQAKEIATPEGTEAPRFTAIESIVRSEGRLFLSGWQNARSFTWVVNEGTGEGTLAVVSDTTIVTLFTACAAADRLR